MRRILQGFRHARPGNWEQLIADLTAFFPGWGPDDGWNLTTTRLRWWVEQQHRMAKEAKGG